MKRDAITRANQELIASLPEGVAVTPRQLERWHQAGLIPKPDVFRGGVRGSASCYPQGTAKQVVELIGILDEGRLLDHALLRLFMRGYAVDATKLKALYVAFFGQFTSDGDALDQAERLVGKFEARLSRDGLARTIRFRLRRRVTRSLPADALVKGVITQMLVAFFSGELDDDHEGTAVAEIRAATGTERMETDPIGNLGPLLPHLSDEEVADMTTAVSLGAVVRGVAEASWDDLTEARDRWAHTARLLSDIADISRNSARKRDYAGLAIVRKVANDEILLALFVPFWIALDEVLRQRGVELDPLWDPATAEGYEHAELFDLVARVAQATSLPVLGDAFPAALAAAPEGIRAEFVAWRERSPERTVID